MAAWEGNDNKQETEACAARNVWYMRGGRPVTRLSGAW